MGKLHELANEQLNPVDGDILEVSHETAPGSTIWGSFRMTLLTLKTYILSYTTGALVKLGEKTSSYTTGTGCTNRTLKRVHIKFVSGTPNFKIGSTSGGSEILTENETAITTDLVISLNEPCYLKTIYPRVTGSGTLNITLEFTQNLFA